jgi:hypothetical protein
MLAKVKVTQQPHADIAFLRILREKKFWVVSIASSATDRLPKSLESCFQFTRIEEIATWFAQ